VGLERPEIFVSVNPEGSVAALAMPAVSATRKKTSVANCLKDG